VEAGCFRPPPPPPIDGTLEGVYVHNAVMRECDVVNQPPTHLSIIPIFQTAAAGMCLIITCATNTIYYKKCIEDTFTMYCSVHGTRLVWSSEQYIGNGGRNLEFGLIDRTGSIMWSSEYNRTMAKLLRADYVNNILESSLTIITVSMNGTVICRDDLREVQLKISVIAGK
jgi:hypothetical protein